MIKNLICAGVLLIFNSLYALTATLPDGREVEVSSKGSLEGKDIDFTFIKPMMLKTPLGENEIISIEYYKSNAVRYIRASGIINVKTSVGVLKGTQIFFHDNGKMEQISANDDLPVTTKSGDLYFKTVQFDEMGRFRGGTLTRPQTVTTSAGNISFGGYDLYGEGKVLRFYTNGLLKGGELSKKQMILGEEYGEGDPVLFSEEGIFMGRVSWEDFNSR